MSDPGLLFGAGFFIVTALGLAARVGWSRDRRIKRALRSVKPTRIAAAPEGKAVKIVGELVYAGRSIPSPLSGRECAYYSIVVQQYRGNGKGGRWRQILREDKGVDFYLRDPSGLALVRVTDGAAWAALVEDKRARVSPILHSDESLHRFLSERGLSAGGRFFRKNLRAAEGILEAGERVAVGGLGRWLPDPAATGGSYRETPKRLVLHASEALPLFLSDDPAAQ